ncbi:MAG: PAS domain S-box protein [Proteobacteria bacterium]|nr:PAS domain S-box protein [Pseudomonadota bacterium]MBU1594066.1 PAS domain S-box protein [Pseudomonadota bacterium]
MRTFADVQRSLTAKVLLGLLGLGVLCIAVYVSARFQGIRASVIEREGARALLLAEPMRFALENLAEHHPEITKETERLQRLTFYLAQTGGVQAVAVLDASGRRALAATDDPAPLYGAGGDLPQRAQSLGRALAEPSRNGKALLVAVPLRQPPKGDVPSQAFGVLVVQFDLKGPVSERQRQTLRDIGVLGLGLLAMILVTVLGLRTFILEPVARLARQTAALGAGDLAARSGLAPPPGGGDEIQRLAADFDRMGLELQAAAAKQARLNEELRASEAKGRAVFEHASIAISQGDALGRVLDANPAFLKLWGCSLEEVRGVRWIDLTHPEDRAESMAQSTRLLAGEIDGFALEKRYLRKDGQVIWASVNVACTRDARGQVEMLVLVAEDITPRKTAEQDRAEREELYRSMFEDNKAVQLLVDPDTASIIDANNAAAEFYGFSREELRGPLTIISELAPELIQRNMAEAKARGGVFHVPHRLKSGETREVVARSGPFRARGRPLLLSTIQDVTELLRAEEALKETEERLRQLIEVMDEGVVLTTPDGRLKFVNPAFARMLDEAPTALEGRRYLDLLTPECAAAHPERMAARRRGARDPYEATYRRQDKGEVLAQVTPFPLFSREGEYQGSCAIIRDITQTRARAEADRLRLLRRSALLRLHEMHSASRQELLDYSLGQMLLLTASPLGYIYSYDEAQRRFTLDTWSKEAMDQCAVQDKQTVYELDATGVWGDAVRLREPVLLNDFSTPDPRRKGCPEGHVPLSRFLTVPVIRAGRVVGVVGVANKAAPYDDEDVTQLRLFSGGLWSVLEHMDAVAQLNAVSGRYRDLASLLRLMCDNVPDMIWAKDMEKRFLFANKAMCEGLLNAQDTSEPVGRTDLHFALREREAHPEDPAWHTFGELCQGSDDIVMRQGAAGQFEESGNVRGRFLCLDVHKAPFVNGQGEVIGTVGSARDITERKRAEEVLLAKTALLEAQTNASLDGILVVNEKQERVLINQRVLELFNAPPHVLDTADDSKLLNHVVSMAKHPDTFLARVEYLYSHPNETGRDEVEFKTGVVLDRYTAPVLSKDGKSYGRIWTFRDITDRKRAEEALRQSEERFRDLFVDAPLPYQSLDEDGNLLLANDAWLATLGYQRQEVIGRNFSEFLHPDMVPQFRLDFPKFKEIGFLHGAEFTMLRKDGSTLLASFNSRISRDEQGRFLRTHCTFQDITDRRQAEEALRRAKAEAEAATLAKAQFLANMSHEIRTPLGGVIGAAQLLAQSRLSGDQRQLADMAVESGQALLSIVNDILDFSKIEAGRLDLRLAPFALRADLEAVAAPYRLLASQRGVALELKVAPKVPDVLMGDHGRLDQVLRNLLGNAVKFTEKGGVTLDVDVDTSCLYPQHSSCVRFTVRDTGQGIPPEFLPHIFESFSQADDSFGKRHGGTGLGLAISRSLVERMGGSLTATSTLGVGSAFTFTLCLPLSQKALLPDLRACTQGAEGQKTAPLRILLAEDNDISRRLLERMLADAGHALACAADGREVLRTLKREAFDLVLMDVQMPVVDGLSATRSIRQGQAGKRNARIPIVALTAYAQPEDRERFLAAGMDDYLPKPVEARELYAVISRAVRLRADHEPGPQAAGSPQPRPDARPGDPSKAPRFDNEYLERTFTDRPELLVELLEQFQSASLPEIEKGLRQALAAQSPEEMQHVAHKAKGTFGTVGARRATLLAQAVGKAARMRDDKAVRQRTEALVAEMSALSEILKQGQVWAEREDA